MNNCNYFPKIHFEKYSAKPTEVQCLQKICNIWQADTGFWSFEEIIKTMSSYKYILIYAYQDDSNKYINREWIGCVLGILLFNVCEIVYIYVTKECRKQNIGMKLMKYLSEELKKQQIQKICLEVRVSNTVAQSLYLKLGFICTGIRKKYYANGEDAILFEKYII